MKDHPEFDFLIPNGKQTFRPDEVAGILGRKLTFVYDLIDEGKLEVLEPTDREVARKVILRRSILAVLAEQYKGDPAVFVDRVLRLLDHLDAHGLSKVTARCVTLRNQRLATA